MKQLAGLILLVFISPVLAQTKFVSVEGREIVAPDGSRLILRGINLGNWLVPEGYMFKFRTADSPREIHDLVSEIVGPTEGRRFWREYQDNYITREDIFYLKRLGFNSVRVPFNYKLLTPEDAPATWSGPGFELLDRVVRWCREAGMWAILDMHCAPGGQTGTNIDDSWGYPWLFESPEDQERTVEVWRRVAARYANEPAVIGYDLLNEPIPHFENLQKYKPLLEPLYKRITAAVREVDKNHLVILGGARWDNDFTVFGPPFDAKAVYTFHKYWTDVTQGSIKEYTDFREKHNVPIWMGESGENQDVWVASFTELLERNGIGWCYWPFKKMDSERGLMTFDKPAYYDEILTYEKSRCGVSAEDRQKLLPALEHARQALAGFLKNCRFENCRANEGFLKATMGATPAGGK